MSYRVSRHSIDDRSFVVVSPERPRADSPLLLFFHGSQQSGNVARNFTAHTFDDLTARGVIVAYPNGVARHFNDARLDFDEKTRELGTDDVGFARAIVSFLGATTVYAAGFSNGGQMVLRLLHDAPGLLSGAATIAAPMPTDDNLLPALGTPVATAFLAIHGTADPIVPYAGGPAGTPNQRRGTVRSAAASVGYFAQVNGSAVHSVTEHDGVRVDTWTGGAPVRLITVEDMGHLVPAPHDVDARLGQGTRKFVAAEVIADFFGL